MLPSLLLVAAALFAQTPAPDWPQLLGPTRNGVYTGTGRKPAAKLWSKSVGAGFAAPVVAGGKLFVFHRQQNQEILEAWNPTDGKKLWAYTYPTAYRDDFGFDEGPRAAPLADSSRVYTFGAEGQLHCVDANTGKKIWSVDTAKTFQVRKGFFGAASSPVIDGNLLLANIGGAAGGIVAFDKATGKTAWTATEDEASYSSPAVLTLGGLKRALFLTRAGLVDLDPTTGKVRYQFPWRSRSNASVNAATPIAEGNVLFLSSSYGTGAIAFEVQGGNYKKLWSDDDTLSNHYSTSVISNGYLYGFHGRQEMGQQLRAVQLRTGKVAWSQDGLNAGTVTLLGDTLLVIRENAEALLVPAKPDRFQTLSKHQLLPATVRAYPAVAGGLLFLRNESTLACYRLD
ncbi:MAG: PQQ-like beta-propeller repeat protein [Bryobacterales bacterium]|nr:PQQ-like beta-propeller repeat protein [Bryobacterales bacterium]